MCERLFFDANMPELQNFFKKVMIGQVPDCPHVSGITKPTEQVMAVRRVEGTFSLDLYRWGLFPFWARHATHADCYTVHNNKAYQRMFQKQRCIIPCSGYTYWKKTTEKTGQEVYLRLQSQKIMALAGLYDIWKDAYGNQVPTCTVMMTDSNSLISPYAPQMPVMLNEEGIKAWLSPDNKEYDDLYPYLKPSSPAGMEVNLSAPMRTKFRFVHSK